mgnify:CR=1 FL=1
MATPPGLVPVENIFLAFPGYNCFVCSPLHPFGFRLEFFADPARGLVVAPLTAREDLAGYPGILHGGFQTMLMDEVAGWAILHQARRIVFTGAIQARFLRPMPNGVPALVCARTEKAGSRLIKASAWIEVAGERKAEAEGSFYSPTVPEFAAATGADPVPERYLPYLR